MERMQERLANLLSVKSLVTVILTVIFAGLSVRGSVSSEQFLTVFTVVISFYFGTQTQRRIVRAEHREKTRGKRAESLAFPALFCIFWCINFCDCANRF